MMHAALYVTGLANFSYLCFLVDCYTAVLSYS